MYYKLEFTHEKNIDFWSRASESKTPSNLAFENCLSSVICKKCKRIDIVAVDKNCIHLNTNFWDKVDQDFGSFNTRDGMPIFSNKHFNLVKDTFSNHIDYYYDSGGSGHGVIFPKIIINPPLNIPRASPVPFGPSSGLNGWRNHRGICSKCGSYNELTVDFDKMVLEASAPIVALLVPHLLHSDTSLHIFIRDDISSSFEKILNSEIELEPIDSSL